MNPHFGRHDRSRKASRQAIDGILNAPANRGRRVIGAESRMRRSSFAHRLRNPSQPRQRLIGDIKRPDSHHPVNKPGHVRTQVHEAHKPKPAQAESPSQSHHISKQFNPDHTDTPSKRKRRRFLRKNRHEHRKQRPKWRRWALRGSIGVVVLVFVAAGIWGYLNMNKVFQGGGHANALSCNAEVDPLNLKKEGDGRINILMLGLDDAAALTDTILVASVDPVTNKAALVSVPRDLWVTNPATGGNTKVNAVFPLAKQAALRDNPKDKRGAERAGVKAVEPVVEKALGLSIHYYVTVDVDGFERAVDIVGGVTIDVPDELAVSDYLWDDVRGEHYHLNVPSGEQKFDQQRALFFVRSRHTSQNGDFDRTARQRLFLQSLAGQVISTDTYTNPVRLARLMDTFGDNVTTNLSIDDAMCLSKVMKGADTSNMESIGLADEDDAVVTTGNMEGQSIIYPIAGIGNYEEVHAYVRSKLVDGYIAKENAPVRVLNGTAIEGIAQERADELKTYGYNIRKVENAPNQDYGQTILIDLTGNNKYTLNYLERRLGVQATTDIPEGVSVPEEQQRKGFIVIIGSIQ